MRQLLDHTIVGQHLTALTIRKDREFAGCAICGTVFQSRLAIEVSDVAWGKDRPMFEHAVAIETREWRARHSRKHTQREHELHRASGRTFTPEAAHKLAPFGLVSLDADDEEVAQSMAESPRAPYDDVETTLKGWV